MQTTMNLFRVGIMKMTIPQVDVTNYHVACGVWYQVNQRWSNAPGPGPLLKISPKNFFSIVNCGTKPLEASKQEYYILIMNETDFFMVLANITLTLWLATLTEIYLWNCCAFANVEIVRIH